jgi:hypothetical protein
MPYWCQLCFMQRSALLCQHASMPRSVSPPLQGVVVFGEQVFENESLVVLLPTPDSRVVVPLKPVRDVTTTLMIKVSHRNTGMVLLNRRQIMCGGGCSGVSGNGQGWARGPALAMVMRATGREWH